MNELVLKSEKGTPITTSLLVAEKFGKEHKDVLETIRNLTAENSAVKNLFYETTYVSDRNREYPMSVMNRDGFSLLVMGFTGARALQFKLDYINAFNKMEAVIKNGQVPGSFKEALLLAAQQQEQIEQQQKQIEEQKPKVWFSDSFDATETLIGIGDLSKLLQQKGINIGQNRLFNWMNKNHYLMVSGKRYSKSKQRYENSYIPTQRAAELGVFYVIPRPIPTQPGDPPMIKHTVKVTGKGVKYFVERFLYNKENNNLKF